MTLLPPCCQREHCKRLHKGDRHLDELLDQHHAMLRSVNPALARRCVLHEDGVLEVVPVPQSGACVGRSCQWPLLPTDAVLC